MTTSFFCTRDDIITACLKDLGAVGKNQSPDTQDFADCSFALNLIIKSWLRHGIPLWKIVSLQLPMLQGIYAYSIGPNSHGPGSLTTDRPVRLFQAFLRDANNKDTPMMIIARKDYDELGDKVNQTGNPNSVYYQPLTTDGLLTVWPNPASSDHTMYLTAQIAINDVNVGTDVMDFPAECYQALKWNLMDEVAEAYRCSDAKIARIERKARMYKEEMESWCMEEASLFLTYDTRFG